VPVLEREPKSFGGPLGHREQVRIDRLREVHDPPVVAEVHRLQLGVPVDAEAADHETLEVASQEVGEPERGRLFLGEPGKRRPAGEELVAVGARQALHAELGEHRIEEATGSAVRVGDEHLCVAVPARLVDAVADAGRDPFRPVVELRWQARDVDAGQRVGEGDELTRQGAATNDEDAVRRCAVRVRRRHVAHR
jgi:hypothetical protein